jgi:hypothetical protein
MEIELTIRSTDGNDEKQILQDGVRYPPSVFSIPLSRWGSDRMGQNSILAVIARRVSDAAISKCLILL